MSICPYGLELDVIEHTSQKMDLCAKETFFLLVMFVSGSLSKVAVPEGYDKYVGL